MTPDIQIFYFINRLPHAAWLNELARWVHYATRTGILYFIIGIVIWFTKLPKPRALVKLGIITAALTYTVTDLILKHAFHRLRPFQTLPHVIFVPPAPQSFSFPSGQAAMAAALALLVVFLYKKSGATIIAIAFAFIVWIDRVYMGHHYPSDVAAGALIGLAIAAIVFRLKSKIIPRTTSL